MAEQFAGGTQCTPLKQPIDPRELGSATLVPSGPVEAGSWQTFTLTYTAGRYGIDDSGALRVCFRYAADHTKPQLTDPKAPGYTVVTTSNNAVLECRFDQKGNVRPFDQTLYVKVVNGYMQEGDTMTVVFGDTSGGSPGMRMQTFVEDTFEFRVLVDPIATFNFQSLPVEPEIAIVAGPPARYLMVVPSMRKAGETFAIGVKGEDVWGNPTDLHAGIFNVVADRDVTGLPARVAFAAGEKGVRIDGLSVADAGPVTFTLKDAKGAAIATQRVLIVAETDLQPYWADFHGQSEETIGTNSAESYFAFARDLAFVDIAGHQGNDFQITESFWADLNALTADMNAPGRFVTLPGYEWSGNTPLGGDRNVFFTTEGRPLRRSSRALLEDRSTAQYDAPTAKDLFAGLAADNEDAVLFAHCGGRYADINVAHDGRFETAVEVHSAWGSFEWLLEDALDLGYRVGVVCNSDGHKGRPGASYPGASSFGAIGGLTCLMLPELTREAVVDALRSRRHYGTTGGPNARMHIDLAVEVEADLCSGDPKLGPATRTPATQLTMGNIAETRAAEARLSVSVSASVGVERIDVFNGRDLVATARNHGDGGSRYRVLMEGAAYRGRFRQVKWDGRASLSKGTIRQMESINFFNPDRVLLPDGDGALTWSLITTGNFAGFDIWVDDADGATLEIETPVLNASAELDALGPDGREWAADGVLPQRLSVRRLPDAPLAPDFAAEQTVSLVDDRDNALFVRVTLEDGTRGWTSPVYLFRPG